MIQNYSQFMTNSQYLFHQKCQSNNSQGSPDEKYKLIRITKRW